MSMVYAMVYAIMCCQRTEGTQDDAWQTYAAHACFSTTHCGRAHPSSACLHFAVIPMETHEPSPLVLIRVLTQLPSFLIVLGLFRAMVQQELSHLLHLSASSEAHHTTERAYISRARLDVRKFARLSFSCHFVTTRAVILFGIVRFFFVNAPFD